MNTRTKMPTYHVKCYETVNCTVAIEAESEDEATELAPADINSHEVIAASTIVFTILSILLNSVLNWSSVNVIVFICCTTPLILK